MNLLIVDDDIPTTQAVRDCVLKMELPVEQIQTAYNVTAAKALLEHGSFDLVICDIEMPRYSGLDLLEWVREKGWEQEFIFLTCHESFSYAARAIRYKADAYIIRPINYDALKNVLTQVTEKLAYRLELKRRSEYGELWLERKERMENALWRELVFADSAAGLRPDKPGEEHQKAGIRFDVLYQLVLCVALTTHILQQQQWDEATFRYAAGNIVGEILFGSPSFARVFHYGREDRVYIVAVVDASAENDAKCARVAQSCKEHLQCNMTVYLSEPCRIQELCDQRLFWEQTDRSNVVRSTPVVRDAQQVMRRTDGIDVDTTRLLALLQQGRSVEAVNTVRKALDAAEKESRISAQTLHGIRQDVMQIVFLYLAQAHVLAHELFEDKNTKQLEAACGSSVFDMVKWIDHVVKKAIDTVAEVRKSETLVEKMKRYVEANCCEEISRDAVGRYLYLSPSYVARVFKQETGRSLREYANECRIERAKQMLAAGRKNVSEIAVAVGFDNFSYFSTLFKKYTDQTPSEYMRQNEKPDDAAARENTSALPAP